MKGGWCTHGAHGKNRYAEDAGARCRDDGPGNVPGFCKRSSPAARPRGSRGKTRPRVLMRHRMAVAPIQRWPRDRWGPQVPGTRTSRDRSGGGCSAVQCAIGGCAICSQPDWRGSGSAGERHVGDWETATPGKPRGRGSGLARHRHGGLLSPRFWQQRVLPLRQKQRTNGLMALAGSKALGGTHAWACPTRAHRSKRQGSRRGHCAAASHATSGAPAATPPARPGALRWLQARR